jgi:hypothetical protein
MGLLDLGLREKAVVLAFLIPIVWIGVYPNPFLTRLEASVGDLLHHMERTASLARREAEPNEVHRASLARREAEKQAAATGLAFRLREVPR